MAKRKKEPQKIRPGTTLPRRVPIPPSQYPMWPVELCQGMERQVRTILSEQPLVIQTHYLHFARKRKLCTKPLFDECEHCQDAQLDTYCYLAVFSPTHRGPAIVAIPRMAMLKTPALVNDEPLFNREIMLQRTGPSKRAPLAVRISTHVLGTRRPDESVDWRYLWRLLLNLWRIELVFDQDAAKTPEQVEEEARAAYWAKMREKRKARQ